MNPSSTTAASASPIVLVELPDIGDLVDQKYRIEGRLGAGGMAVVLAARHVALDEPVALKFLLPEWTDDPELVTRFMREGRAATKIRSEHVVRVHDVGAANGVPYLVLERLDGEDLDQILKRRGALPISIAVDLLLQACEAIAEAHALGIIHRDLKPANLFLTHRVDGSTCMKVLDFGISKVSDPHGGYPRSTMPNAVMGSPHYMSPEQMQSVADADARTDIWSLGIILYELLTGELPWRAPSLTALYTTILSEPPQPMAAFRSDVPGELEAVVRRCLDKEANRRFATVAELSRALAPYGSDQARTSAERITRVIEGTSSGPPASSWSVSAPSSTQRARAMTAAERLLGEDPTLPAMQPPPRRVSGYVVGTVVLTAAAAVAMIGFRPDLLRAARTAMGPAATPTTELVAPSAVTTVTAADAPTFASAGPIPAATVAPLAVMAPAVAGEPAIAARPAHHHAPRASRPIAPLPNFPVPADTDNPFDDVAATAAPETPAPATTHVEPARDASPHTSPTIPATPFTNPTVPVAPYKGPSLPTTINPVPPPAPLPSSIPAPTAPAPSSSSPTPTPPSFGR